jgi:hypothetical protein
VVRQVGVELAGDTLVAGVCGRRRLCLLAGEAIVGAVVQVIGVEAAVDQVSEVAKLTDDAAQSPRALSSFARAEVRRGRQLIQSSGLSAVHRSLNSQV